MSANLYQKLGGEKWAWHHWPVDRLLGFTINWESTGDLITGDPLQIYSHHFTKVATCGIVRGSWVSKDCTGMRFFSADSY